MSATFEVRPEDVPEVVVARSGAQWWIACVYCDPSSGEKAVHMSEVPITSTRCAYITGDIPRIDPTRIADYLAVGGYSALAKALSRMSSDQVLQEVKKAVLRGRGGGGFPAGLKWETTKNAPEKTKYVIVNGHEGESAAFMDRAMLTGNPHKVLEA